MNTITRNRNIYWTNDPKDLSDWDLFIQSTSRGHYLQLSTWLKAYTNYGFSISLLILKDEKGFIYGGLGVIKIRFGFLSFNIAPVGPIILEGFEADTEILIQEFYDTCKRENVVYAHINMPIIRDGQFEYGLPSSILNSNSCYFTGKKGIKFKNISTIEGFRWIDLKKYNYTNCEEYLLDLTPKVRRDIRASMRKGLELKIAENMLDIRKAYTIFEENAVSFSYKVRSWGAISSFIEQSHKDGTSIFLIAKKKEEIKGAIWLVKAGKRFTYMMGGSKKENPDLLVGYFLQWNAIKISLKNGFDGYDISVGGPQSVTRFKNGFNATYIPFIGSRYWVFKKNKFLLYMYISSFLKKNKAIIEFVLRIFNSIKYGF